MSDRGSGPLVEEHPGRPPADTARDGGMRGLPPIAYPLLAVVFGGALVWSFSRVLLAVGKDQAVAIAILMALNILVGAALIAYGQRVRRRPVALPFLVVAGLGIIAIGLVANFAYGDRGPEKKREALATGQTVNVTAQGTKFIPTSLSFTAGKDITIVFDNKDSLQHNIAIFQGKDATGSLVFRGALDNGPNVTQYHLKAPPAGTYFFHCDVHPLQMTGTITVTAGGPAPGTTVTAQNTAFIPTKVTATVVGGKVTIHFVNKDAATQHNIAIFQGNDATAPVLFRGDFVLGPATKDYTFTAPPPGTYFFHCDVHPLQMQGSITIS